MSVKTTLKGLWLAATPAIALGAVRFSMVGIPVVMFPVSPLPMNVIRNFLIALTVAAWLALVAILAIQNITPVQLNVLVLTSMNLPVGVLLAMSAGAGMITGSLLWPLIFRQR